MRVIHHVHCTGVATDDGLPTVVANRDHGLQRFEVATQALDPGAASAVVRQVGEMVVLALAGSGKLLVDGGPQRFQAPCTLVLPRDAEFRVVNNGAVALHLVWVSAPDAREAPGARSA
jgi:uncharacterized cupin superfamily protein